MARKPYYLRTLEDFPDDVITAVRASKDYWYARLNSPDNIHGRSMPDFSTCRRTRESAVADCARIMREDAKGIGKYAPHSCFYGYNLHFILCAHWAAQMGELVDHSPSWMPDRP